MKPFVACVLALFVAASAACQNPEVKPSPADSRPSADVKGRKMGEAIPIVMEKDREVYGAELTFKEVTKIDEILKDTKAYAGRKVLISGTIDSVCQKRGCWMIIKDGETRTQVKFQGYGFFVPFDVAGRTVKVEGMAKETELSEKMRRHYAEDAGKSKEEIEKIVGPEKTVMFIADAVEVGAPVKADAKKGAESKPVK
jgi:Domain of unknown function (DUF4920)